MTLLWVWWLWHFLVILTFWFSVALYKKIISLFVVVGWCTLCCSFQRDIPFIFHLLAKWTLLHLRQIWVVLFSSPEPLAHGELLSSLDVYRPSCIVCHPSSTITSKDISSLTTVWSLTNLVGMIFIRPSFKIVQIVLVHSITRSHRLK